MIGQIIIVECIEGPGIPHCPGNIRSVKDRGKVTHFFFGNSLNKRPGLVVDLPGKAPSLVNRLRRFLDNQRVRSKNGIIRW